jgi:ParB-like chromosome segregation protein Spo0J
MKINFRTPEIVDISLLKANDYNPNRMPKKEMDLLAECISTYGFLFPIVVNKEGDHYNIIDGYHRYETLKRLKSEKASVINLDISVEQRMQLTVLMNRIKGMHQVESMSNLVVKLHGLGMNDSDICQNLGMEAEEYIRLKQQLGIASYYKNHDFSKSWEVK